MNASWRLRTLALAQQKNLVGERENNKQIFHHLYRAKGRKRKNGLRRQFEGKMNSICDQFNVERNNEKEREKSAFKF